MTRRKKSRQRRPDKQEHTGKPKNRRNNRQQHQRADAGLVKVLQSLSKPELELLIHLTTLEHPVSADHCANQLEVSGDVSDRLRALKQQQLLTQATSDQWQINADLKLAGGAVSAHPDGYGFVLTPAAHDDVYLDEQQMATLMHGDVVLVRTRSKQQRGKVFGELLVVVERARRYLVGRVVETGRGLVLSADNPRITDTMQVQHGNQQSLNPGVIVVAEIARYPAQDQPGVVSVLRELDDSNEAGLATEIAIIQHDLPEEFSSACLREADAFGEQIDNRQLQHRSDLRELPLITIDGADARDFDDAVYCEQTADGWRLVVAIADVASYVRPGSALDDDAWERGTSVYFPTRVVPMLPEALSNGLCSLRPQQERLALVCDMLLQADGRLQKSRHYKAVMRSHARLTYADAQAIIDADAQAPSAAVGDSLQALKQLFALQTKLRQERGALAFDRPESTFTWRDDGAIASIDKRTRNTSHKIIEESMILANVATARYLQQRRQPALYRVHAPPQGRKLEELTQLLAARAIQPTWREQPEPKDFLQLQQQCAGREDAHIIDEALLRAQSLAVYLPDNDGHFGLALDAYCHFTSPIRRYPDLVVHRALHALIEKEPVSSYIAGEDADASLQQMASHCSTTERRAETAVRDVEWRLTCDYMQDFIGTTFAATVTGIKPFGMFVELHDPVVSGLVHISQMGKDYFIYEESSQQLRNRRSGQCYSMSDRVSVKLIDVDIDQRKLNFGLEKSPQ